MALVFAVILVTVPWAISEAGGLGSVTAGLGGRTGDFANPFDPWVAYSFGIPVTIGLMSGPIGDQQHWQRAFSLRSSSLVLKTFGLGSLLFLAVPLSLSMLGFLAANGDVSGSWAPMENSQLVGPAAVSNLLPSFMLIVFSIMLLSGLCSTLDSVLCAGAAIAVVDLPAAFGKSLSSDESSSQHVRLARTAMVVIAIIGFGIASIPGLQILHLFLFYGTLRATTMIPTILTVLDWKIPKRAAFWAILLSLIFGAPLYALGAYLGNPHMSVSGSLLVVIIGFLVCWIGSKRKLATA